MSDATTTPPLHDGDDTQATGEDARCEGSRKGFRRRKHGRLLLGIGVVGLAIWAFLPPSFAGPGRFFGGHHGHARGPLTMEKAQKRLDFAADRISSRIDATDEQRAQLQAVLAPVAKEMIGVHREGQALGDAFAAAIEGGEPDARELETLRKRALQLADKASKRALDTLLEVSAVMTPEQRADLAEDFRRMRKWRRGSRSE